MITMSFARVASALAVSVFLAACAAPPPPKPLEVEGYGLVEDGGHTIPAIPVDYIPAENRRTTVAYAGDEAPGTIVVDPVVKYLYLVKGDGTADRYRIAVGAEGRALRRTTYVGRKAEWPSWTPTANMLRTQPELYAGMEKGMGPGPMNPLGARALYLYRDGRDTMYRIHGTGDHKSIGNATSAGCIRLYNQDIIDIYTKVDGRPTVKIRTLAESRAMEGDAAVDAGLAADAAFLAGL